MSDRAAAPTVNFGLLDNEPLDANKLLNSYTNSRRGLIELQNARGKQEAGQALLDSIGDDGEVDQNKFRNILKQRPQTVGVAQDAITISQTQQGTQQEQAKARMSVIGNSLAALRFRQNPDGSPNPATREDILSELTNLKVMGLLSPAQFQSGLPNIPTDPAQISEFLRQQSEKVIAAQTQLQNTMPQLVTTDTGDTTQFDNRSPRTGAIGSPPGTSSIPMQMSPSQLGGVVKWIGRDGSLQQGTLEDYNKDRGDWERTRRRGGTTQGGVRGPQGNPRAFDGAPRDPRDPLLGPTPNPAPADMPDHQLRLFIQKPTNGMRDDPAYMAAMRAELQRRQGQGTQPGATRTPGPGPIPGPAPGDVEAMKASADQFVESQKQAGRFTQDMTPILGLYTALKTAKTGPGTETLNDLRSRMQGFTPEALSNFRPLGGSAAEIAAFDEAQKYSAGMQRGQTGATGSVAQLDSSGKVTPGPSISPLAAQYLTRAMAAQRRMEQAAHLAFVATKRPRNEFGDFLADWNGKQDAAAFAADLTSKDARAKHFKSLSPHEKERYIESFHYAEQHQLIDMARADAK